MWRDKNALQNLYKYYWMIGLHPREAGKGLFSYRLPFPLKKFLHLAPNFVVVIWCFFNAKKKLCPLCNSEGILIFTAQNRIVLD